jgi:hypothetical protein
MAAIAASPIGATACDTKKSFKNFTKPAATIAIKVFATYAASNAGTQSLRNRHKRIVEWTVRSW